MNPADVVARHEGLVQMQSHHYATEQTPAEDLAQEARIALYREAVKRPGDNLDKLASFIVKRRVIRVSMTGTTYGLGPKGSQKSATPAVWTDGVENKAERERIALRAGVAPSAESVALRLLDVERVREAVTSLPYPLCDIAVAKMYEEPASTTASRLGYSTSFVNRAWADKVVPRLRVLLESA